MDVRIAEVKIAKKGEILKCILGSCVGIAFIWKQKKICGLAHCLLPLNPDPSFEIGARFVDQAFKSLIALMRIRPEDYSQVDVVIVGGGNMTNPEEQDDKKMIGYHNYSAALNEAKKYSFKVLFSEGGGEEGRKIFVDSTSLTYRVEKIPRIIKAS